MSGKSLMHGGGESSDRIVPTRSANKGRRLSAGQVEGRRSAKEIPAAWADAGHWAREHRCNTMPRERVQAAVGCACSSPRWEPCALVARARVCAGGSGQPLSLPRPPHLVVTKAVTVFCEPQ